MSHAGFKLDRFEVYNWGTFDEKVWVIETKRSGAFAHQCENGSGKSTLVDALLTLLVPNVKAAIITWRQGTIKKSGQN